VLPIAHARVKLHFITLDEGPHWSQMLRDRSLTSHTYTANVADEIIGRLTSDYVRCFRRALERLRSSSQPL
jgi:hypothetical protein